MKRTEKRKVKLWLQQWHLCWSNNIRGLSRLSGSFSNNFPGNVKIKNHEKRKVVFPSWRYLTLFLSGLKKLLIWLNDYLKSPPPSCFHSSWNVIVLDLNKDANVIRRRHGHWIMEEAFLINTPFELFYSFDNWKWSWIIHFQHAENKNIYVFTNSLGKKMFHRNRISGKKIISHQNDLMRYNTSAPNDINRNEMTDNDSNIVKSVTYVYIENTCRYNIIWLSYKTFVFRPARASTRSSKR